MNENIFMLIEHGTWIWEKEVHFSVFQIVYKVYTKLPIKIDINRFVNKLCLIWDDQKLRNKSTALWSSRSRSLPSKCIDTGYLFLIRFLQKLFWIEERVSTMQLSAKGCLIFQNILCRKDVKAKEIIIKKLVTSL